MLNSVFVSGRRPAGLAAGECDICNFTTLRLSLNHPNRIVSGAITGEEKDRRYF
jgi:hypothetical protein